MTRPKRKSRTRRTLTPVGRRAVDTGNDRLRSASVVAYVAGLVLAILGSLGPQCSTRAAATLGASGSMALRIAGVGLVIAGWLLGRAKR